MHVHGKTTWEAIADCLMDRRRKSQEIESEQIAKKEEINSLREEVGRLRQREAWNGAKLAIEKQEHIKVLLESEADELNRMRLEEQYSEARKEVEMRLGNYAKAEDAYGTFDCARFESSL